MFERAESPNGESFRNMQLSVFSTLLIGASTTAMLLAPSIPNTSLAICEFLTFAFATILSKVETIRLLLLDAFDRSASIRFFDRAPFGDAWNYL